MRSANQWCDRLVAALRIKNRAAREKELRQIHWDFGTLRVRVANPDYRTKLFLALGSTKTRSENLGDLMLALSMPAMGKVQNAADRTRQVHDNLTLAFALAWYHRDHGRYPKTLDALAPKYVKEIPPDLFSGKPLIYPPSGSGYLLYSVGVNGKDEGGRGEEDMAPGDYLSVRMPQPDLPREGEAADPAPPPVP
jgi:hypothetical protein